MARAKAGIKEAVEQRIGGKRMKYSWPIEPTFFDPAEPTAYLGGRFAGTHLAAADCGIRGAAP